jgi:indolepyruvate ferredoxin oxidoreductase
MMAAFRLLARFKVVRGAVLDPSGWFAERKDERAFIDNYRAMLEELIVGLTAENHAIAEACASLSEQVSSYGPVKAEAIRQCRELRAAQLHRLQNPASVVQVQEVA